MKKLAVVTLISALSLSSCAFIFGDGRDDVTIKTVGNKPASCKIKSGKQIWNVTAPATIRVDKSTKNIKVSCSNKKAGTVGSATVKPKALQDFAGSYDYPAEVVIKMFVPKKKVTVDEESAFFEDEQDKPLNILPAAPE